MKNVPASASGAAGYSVHYGYDLRNAQLYARFGSAAGQGITNAYDGLGRPTSTGNSMGGTARTLSYQYDAGGRRSRLTFPDGNYFTYDHAASGNLRSEPAPAQAGGTTSYVYDAENRLVSASGGTSASLAYDPLGRLFQTSGGAAGTTRFGE